MLKQICASIREVKYTKEGLEQRQKDLEAELEASLEISYPTYRILKQMRVKLEKYRKDRCVFSHYDNTPRDSTRLEMIRHFDTLIAEHRQEIMKNET